MPLLQGIPNSKQILRSTQDGLQGIMWELRIDRSLNDFFVGMLQSATTNEMIDLDTYWLSTGLTVPANYTTLKARTRRNARYGICTTKTKIPLLAVDNQICFMGFEQGGATPIPWALFKRNGITNACQFSVTGAGVERLLNITNLMPTDYDTVAHVYTVKLNRHSAELLIDSALRAIILLDLPDEMPTWENNKPYALRSWPYPFGAIEQPGLWEIDRAIAYAGSSFVFPVDITGNKVILADGDPCPPRQWKIYTENTETEPWVDLAVGSAVNKVSHPFVLWGYEKKILYYKLTATLSTAKLEIYVGGDWEKHTDLTVDGAYHMLDVSAEEAPIGRLNVTGGVGGGTVNFAQVNCR